MLDAWSHCSLRPQQLEIDGRCWPGRSDNLDWSSLTNLRATFWTRDEFLDVLRHAPNLHSCRLEHLSGPDATTTSSESHVRHDCIQQLSINFWDRADSTVDFITTPNLRDFQCDSSRDVNMSLSTFFARSSFPLTRLDLCLGSYTSTSLISLLDMVPLLEHLTLSMKSSDEAVIYSFLKHLSSTTMLSCTSEVDYADSRYSQDHTKTFLPHLECLIFRGEFRFPWSSAHHALGVPSNFGKPGWRPLKSLIVQHRSEAALPENWVDRDTVARLIELRNVGAAIAYDVVGRDRQITFIVNWEDYL
ncbi:hypothetical protein CPC08DRAFT_764053 [Agrocybe pediades]|nr:hypothetical protein CPC08DRAFT_764053 [Agrocybe pediades]